MTVMCDVNEMMLKMLPRSRLFLLPPGIGDHPTKHKESGSHQGSLMTLRHCSIFFSRPSVLYFLFVTLLTFLKV